MLYSSKIGTRDLELSIENVANCAAKADKKIIGLAGLPLLTKVIYRHNVQLIAVVIYLE